MSASTPSVPLEASTAPALVSSFLSLPESCEDPEEAAASMLLGGEGKKEAKRNGTRGTKKITRAGAKLAAGGVAAVALVASVALDGKMHIRR